VNTTHSFIHSLFLSFSAVSNHRGSTDS